MDGTYRLIQANPAALATLEELKAHLNLTGDSEDGNLTRYLKAAHRNVENHSGRSLLTQTWQLVLPGWPCDSAIRIGRPKLQSITSIKYRDTAEVERTLSADDYVVHIFDNDALVGLKYSLAWPSVTLSPYHAVTIEFVAGWTDEEVPEDAKNAVLLQAGHYYLHREDVLVGESSEIKSAVLVRGADDLMSPYKCYL